MAPAVSVSEVSVLFNEPKLLKYPGPVAYWESPVPSFSALQRAEIAEIALAAAAALWLPRCFSALQRAEIAEIGCPASGSACGCACFSALQRAEIAEMRAA